MRTVLAIFAGFLYFVLLSVGSVQAVDDLTHSIWPRFSPVTLPNIPLEANSTAHFNGPVMFSLVGAEPFSVSTENAVIQGVQQEASGMWIATGITNGDQLYVSQGSPSLTVSRPWSALKILSVFFILVGYSIGLVILWSGSFAYYCIFLGLGLWIIFGLFRTSQPLVRAI